MESNYLHFLSLKSVTFYSVGDFNLKYHSSHLTATFSNSSSLLDYNQDTDSVIIGWSKKSYSQAQEVQKRLNYVSLFEHIWLKRIVNKQTQVLELFSRLYSTQEVAHKRLRRKKLERVDWTVSMNMNLFVTQFTNEKTFANKGRKKLFVYLKSHHKSTIDPTMIDQLLDWNLILNLIVLLNNVTLLKCNQNIQW